MNAAIIDKIRKCLALSASANEHEAAAALAKAMSLMAEHGVSHADIELAEIAEASCRATDAQNAPRWEAYLSMAVCRALGVRAFRNGEGGRTFVGVGPAADIASYAFTNLFRRLKAARSAYIKSQLRRCKPGRKRLRADVFCEAWAAAVFDAIASLAPAREAPLLECYLAERHPNLVPATLRTAKLGDRAASGDWWRGHDAGRGERLHHGVNGGATSTAMLVSA